MPADFELIPGTRTVYSRGWGALTDADLLGHMARISALFKAGTLDAEWAQIGTSPASRTRTVSRLPAFDGVRKEIPGRAPPSASAS